MELLPTEEAHTEEHTADIVGAAEQLAKVQAFIATLTLDTCHGVLIAAAILEPNAEETSPGSGKFPCKVYTFGVGQSGVVTSLAREMALTTIESQRKLREHEAHNDPVLSTSTRH